MDSWITTPEAQSALLDELVKIGDDAEKRLSNKQRIRQALKTIGFAGAGAGIGYGIAEGLEAAIPRLFLAKKPVTKGMLQAAKITLPILGMAGGILGSRYRRHMDEEMFGSAPNARR